MSAYSMDITNHTLVCDYRRCFIRLNTVVYAGIRWHTTNTLNDFIILKYAYKLRAYGSYVNKQRYEYAKHASIDEC